MRIFVIPGTFNGANLGDLAMFQVAVTRLKALWPGAGFFVLAQSLELVESLQTSATTEASVVSTRDWSRWLARKRGSWKSFFPQHRAGANRFSRTLLSSDLVVMAGSGIFTDAFQETGSRILTLLQAAAEQGIPTVVAGQGIGPMENAELRAQAAKVLPLMDAIFIREPDASLALLRTLNVIPERIVVTGDDAIELAAKQPRPPQREGIGVNLRMARYANFSEGLMAMLRDVLHRKALQLEGKLLGIPISRVSEDSDVETLKFLVPEDPEPGLMPWTTGAVIERVSRCRVMVTGSYHAGVFALAQGVPVVAIVQSGYYAQKFNGLARQFPGGCVVVFSGESGFATRLENAVDDAWNSSDAVLEGLRLATKEQIRAGEKAYGMLPELVSRRPGKAHLAPV
ncbi:MAG: polysaccharide pyruvyl transferase family protein [Akkermansiaceae bacterium]|nr:polysaccharide pyruvyl transferase family protein [Verrucomicrobiales bacterium]